MKWLIPTLRIYRPDAARCAAALGLVGLTTASAVIKPWPLAWILDALSGRSGDTDSIPAGRWHSSGRTCCTVSLGLLNKVW